MRKLMMGLLLRGFRLNSIRKIGLLSILLTAGLLVSHEGKAEVSSFDYVTFNELNQQSAQVWNALVKRQGAQAAANSLKSAKTVPPEVRLLGQQLRQFIISSHIHFTNLSNDMASGKANDVLYENVNPLLRHLLQNSILLDLDFVVQETKPGFLSPASHRSRLIDLYGRAFQTTDPLAWVRQRAKQSEPNPYEDLMVRVRGTAIAGILAQTRSDSKCLPVLSLGWGIQVRKTVNSMSVGPETTRLFNGAFLAAFNDLALCAHAYIEEQLDKGRYDLIADIETFNEKQYTRKELVQMARNLFGE